MDDSHSEKDTRCISLWGMQFRRLRRASFSFVAVALWAGVIGSPSLVAEGQAAVQREGRPSGVGITFHEAAADLPESRAVVDAFLKACIRGDDEAAHKLMSPRLYGSRPGDIRRQLRENTLVFFMRFHVPGELDRVIRATDDAGAEGRASFGRALDPATGERAPWMVATVREGGRYVVANVSVHQRFPGFHEAPHHPWFPRMETPPHVQPAVPADFALVPLSEREGWSMLSGVAWCPPASVAWARGVRDRMSRGEDLGEQPEPPLVTVWLSGEVGQTGPDAFSIDAQLDAAPRENPGIHFRVERTRWGGHPVLAYTATTPEGGQVRAAYVGLNASGWVLELHCNQPGEAADALFWGVVLETKALPPGDAAREPAEAG